MARNPDSAAAINLTRVAGKDVTQGRWVTLRREFEGGGEASLTLFGIGRSLRTRPRSRTSTWTAWHTAPARLSVVRCRSGTWSIG